jgi:hypothetical protein
MTTAMSRLRKPESKKNRSEAGFARQGFEFKWFI